MARSSDETPTDCLDEFHGRSTRERRRLVRELLATRTAPVGLEELAAAVAARGTGPDDSLSADRVALALHHDHLPRLADRGVVDYDPERRRVESIESSLDRD